MRWCKARELCNTALNGHKFREVLEGSLPEKVSQMEAYAQGYLEGILRRLTDETVLKVVSTSNLEFCPNNITAFQREYFEDFKKGIQEGYEKKNFLYGADCIYEEGGQP